LREALVALAVEVLRGRGGLWSLVALAVVRGAREGESEGGSPARGEEGGHD